MSERDTQGGPEGALSRTLARGTRPAPHQDYARHGNVKLQNPGDGAKGDMGVSARLQPHPADDGPGRHARRLPAARVKLQAHVASLDRLGPSRVRHRRR